MKSFLIFISLLFSVMINAQPPEETGGCYLDKYEMICTWMVRDEHNEEMFYREEYLEDNNYSLCYSDGFLFSKGYTLTKTSHATFRHLDFVINTYVNCHKLIILTVFMSNADYLGIVIEAINPKFEENFPKLLRNCVFVEDSTFEIPH